MAGPTRPCPSCGKPVHPRKKECPHCGAVLGKSTGKRAARSVVAKAPVAADPFPPIDERGNDFVAPTNGAGALVSNLETVVAAHGLDMVKKALAFVESLAKE